jgi:hypothetical protein
MAQVRRVEPATAEQRPEVATVCRVVRVRVSGGEFGSGPAQLRECAVRVLAGLEVAVRSAGTHIGKYRSSPYDLTIKLDKDERK